MYFQGRLCVPETLLSQVLTEFHATLGHVGVSKMSKMLDHHFVLPTTSVTSIISDIRSHCIICQAATPPHFSREGRQEPFPIPERLMHSVCLDVFAMPPTQWKNFDYDAILLCVDRLSGWIIACPTNKQGLTAEKAALLLLDKGWEPFGIPSTVHSDMGPQFVGQWWKNMCAFLGIHQTFSQPHRPRADGIAERAGQQLL